MTLLLLAAGLLGGETIVLGTATRVVVVGQGKVRLQGEKRADIACNVAVHVHAVKDWLRIVVKEPGDTDIRVPRTLSHVVIENPAGEADVYDLDGDTVIRASRRIVANNLGRSTLIDTMGGEVRVGRANGDFRCVSGGGPVEIESADSVNVQSRGGDIIVGLSMGRIFARTLGGNIRVGRAKGGVDLQTSGGSIEVGGAESATCRSGSGGIRIKGTRGAIAAETGRGTILVEFAGQVLPSRLFTAMGDIVAVIPSNLALTIEATIPNPAVPGRITSEFPEFQVFGMRALGQLNGGGPAVKLTAGGSIWLRKKDSQEK